MTENPLEKNQNRIKAGLAVLAAAELLLMAAAILFDLLIPSIVVAVTGILFMLVRKERMPVGKLPQKLTKPRFVLLMLGFAVFWSVVEYALIMPVQNHLLNDTRNVTEFASVYRNLPNLLLMLLASWTLAAIVEEVAFRGFFQNRIISLFANQQLGTITAVVVTSVFFGVIHAEQGIVGIVVTAIDSAFFSIIRYRYKSVWASALVHGFMNSIGLITFYFTGPIFGLW
jgi:membrane protease YdiL (CAAX protease family)